MAPLATEQKLPDGTLQWTTGQVVTSMRVLAPGVVYVASSGSGAQEFLPALAAALEAEAVRHGRITVFANLLDAPRMSTEARDQWAAWSKKLQPHVAGHCLVRSKLLEMALSLIAMFARSELRSYSELERFEAAIKAVAPDAVLPPRQKVA
jgi:hypothetical protein